MRAYQILRDLEMIVPTPNPNDPKYDSSRDDELAPENNYIRQYEPKVESKTTSTFRLAA
jgi:hypothetical protein